MYLGRIFRPARDMIEREPTDDVVKTPVSVINLQKVCGLVMDQFR